MRRMLVVAAALGACSQDRAATTYITIGTDAIGTVRALAAEDRAQLDVLEIGDDAAIVAIDPAELATLSEQMHREFHRCGGFMRPRLARRRAAPRRSGPTKPVDYTLDRAAVVRAVLPALDAARRSSQTIRELSAMPNRYYKSAAGAEASNWLAERWRSFATRPGVTVQLVDHGYPQKSVVLTIPGTTRADEVIVIGGHLDSIAMGGMSANAPGADDDASGIATLTEIARVLLAADYRPERTIKFIAYEAEEVGLRGSQAIVRDFKRAKHERGRRAPARHDELPGLRQGHLVDEGLHERGAERVPRSQLIETYTGATWGLDACGYACSDHASWTARGRAGVDAVRVADARSATSTSTPRRDTLAAEQRRADARARVRAARCGVRDRARQGLARRAGARRTERVARLARPRDRARARAGRPRDRAHPREALTRPGSIGPAACSSRTVARFFASRIVVSRSTSATRGRSTVPRCKSTAEWGRESEHVTGGVGW